MEGYRPPTCPDGLEGVSSTNRGELLKAAAHYSIQLKSSPGDCTLYAKRAWILLELNKISKVLSDANIIIELQPDSYLGHFLKVR